MSTLTVIVALAGVITPVLGVKTKEPTLLEMLVFATATTLIAADCRSLSLSFVSQPLV